MVKEVATSIITVATLMSCLVACSGSDSDAELRAKIADLEEELEEQQIASNDLDSESTTTDAEPESTATDAKSETNDIEAPDLTIMSKHPTIECLNGVFDKFVNVFGMYVVATLSKRFSASGSAGFPANIRLTRCLRRFLLSTSTWNSFNCLT